jgi:hypothetical protein
MRILGSALFLSVALCLTSVATPSFAFDWSVVAKRNFGKTKVCCKVKGRFPFEEAAVGAFAGWAASILNYPASK